MMKLSRRSQGFILVVVIALAAGFLFQSQRLYEVTVAVEGPADTRVVGNYTVDGVEHAIDGEAPFDFVVTCRQLECSFQKGTQPGRIAVTLTTARSGTVRAVAGPGESVECGFRKKGGALGASAVWAHKVDVKND